jgi:hypothetical protein
VLRIGPPAHRHLGQAQQTGVPQIDKLVASPTGRIVTAGLIGVAASKAFPGKTVGSFALGAILAIATGLTKDVTR